VCAGRVTFDILPDDVLLHIFSFESFNALWDPDRLWGLSWWYRLVQVCRRWRSVISTWPTFLNLKLVYGPWARTVMQLAIWPTLPIIITNVKFGPDSEPKRKREFDFAVVHHNHSRICEIDFHATRWKLEGLKGLVSAMQEPFPALRRLRLRSDVECYRSSALPDGFLGGSTTRLQFLELDFIPFPALPNLLLSATDLVDLRLWNIPGSAYISSEVMLTSLAVLTNLKSLAIGLGFPPDLDQERQNQTLPTHVVLLALTHFEFREVSRYLEDLLVQIDSPLLDSICITFSHDFDPFQFAPFIRHTAWFDWFQTLNLNEAHVDYDYYGILVDSLPPAQALDKKFRLRISWERQNDWHPSFLTGFLESLFPSIYIVKHLYIYGSGRSQTQFGDDIDDMQWLDIFYPFTAVKKLHISEEFAQDIAPALQQLVGESATDVLPALECIVLEELQPSGPVQEAFGQFIAARQLSGHPVAVSHWDRRGD
jgi:F-box-like